MAKANDGFFKKLFSRNKRGYEGASRSKRLKRWRAPSSSANTEIIKDLKTLRNRCRDLRRNNPIMNKIILTIGSNVVGKGIKTKFEGDLSDFVQDEWNKWAETTACDFNDQMNFYGMQRLVIESTAESGEIIARKLISKKEMKIQLLESDFIASANAESVKSGNGFVEGVELNNKGQVVAYHLYETHPGDHGTFGYKTSATEYKVNRFDVNEIYHVFRIDRPGQARGIPWSSSIIVRLKDLDEFIDATVMKQKVSACFAGFVTDMSADLVDPEEANLDHDIAGMIEPGIIEELPPGKSITFADPPTMENIKEFTSTVGHNISAGVGLSYESITGDLSEVNFSSGRMGHLEMARNLDCWREHVLVGRFINPVIKDFIRTLELKTGKNLSSVKWRNINPRREMIDPTREIPAIIKSIRSGLSTVSEEITAMGKDPDKVLNQISKDNELIDSLNLVLDSDPRKITVAGIKQLEEEVKNEKEN